MGASTDREKTLALARRPAGVTAREVTAAGIHGQVLTRVGEVTEGEF